MKSLFGAVSLAALLLAAPAWAQNPQAENSHRLSTQDQTFVKETLAANLAQVKLGRLAEQKAAKPEVNELGRWMSTDDGFANKRLMTLTKEAGGTEHAMLTEKDQDLQKQLKSASGSQFDDQYLKAVVQAEQKGIRQFKAEALSGQDPKIKAYAANLTPVLQQHLAEAQELGGASSTGSGSSVPPRG